MMLAQAAPLPVLSLDDAIAAARAHHPQIIQAHAQTGEAEAAANVSRGSLLPQINGAANYSRSTSNFVSKPGAVPRDVSRNDPSEGLSSNYFSFSLQASQLLFDFGEMYNNWRAARVTALGQRASEWDVLSKVLLAVRQAFFDARAKRALLQVARDTLANQDRHRNQVESFVAVGKRPEIDLLQARTDYATARLKLVTAENDYLIAKATLNQTMGREDDADYDIADTAVSAVPGEDAALDVLLAEALGARPDFAAAESTLQARELTLRAAYAGYAPQLSAQGALTEQGLALNGLLWNWSVGVQLQVPLFQGGVLQANVDSARHTVNDATASRDLLRQQVRLDVQQARLGVRGAKEETAAALESYINAAQLLALAEGRYAAGVGTFIELGDAQVAATTAAGQKVQAELHLATARATMLRALGRDAAASL